ncbi:ribonuclease-3 family protein [[Clostridium] fimetarium]|uniref:Mini-ribonuclease 3 n=2 Tax=[Clostridium] fimetarium TaxID=99656 RepID=A0A1I0NL09_9FIRM|nr:ribonuclease III domain-containing protein [[Clostridium] fimetarium]SEW01928.1 ribonuclease-3 family protein [[Clostridium] fimetarium]
MEEKLDDILEKKIENMVEKMLDNILEEDLDNISEDELYNIPEDELDNKNGQDFISAMKNGLGLKEVNILTYSPLTLAYIGDDAYDLVIRTFLVNQGNMQVNKINKRANSIVKAETQSKMVRVIEPILSDEERAVYKRGRNAKSASTAKNASVNDYRRATGFEALIGYLYLLGRYERMIELIKISLEDIGEL